MSTLANTLKSEIARVARKELKDELLTLRKAVSSQRTEIAALKRDVKGLLSLVKKAQRSAAKASPAAKPESSEAPKARRGRQAQFDAEKLSSYRAQLGITRVQMAQLIGASALSVYKWESGKVQPRAAQTAQILAVLKLGKRAALAKLAEGTAG